MDKEAANPGLVMGQLAEHGVIADAQGWGGDVPMVEVSAKTGLGIETLLDTVLLVADIEELKADIDVPAEGLVIESHMETGRGPVVGLLVEQGALKPGQFMVAGTAYGKVRTLLDFAGKPIKTAGPSTPVTVTGFKELPQFGDVFTIVKKEKDARLATEKARIEREKNAASTNVTGADLLKMMNQKYDTQVMDSLRLVDTNGEIRLRIIGSGVGSISESDVRLAADSDTIIYGFNVDLPPAVKRLAMRDKVQVRIYKIIYELLDDARNSMEAMLAPEVVETEIGKLTIKGIFRTLKEEVIAGGEVTSGKAVPNVLARVIRGNETLGEVEVTKVQRQQQEAKEVFEGEMCGISLKTTKKLTLEEGDKLEFFTRELVKRTLK
jgi:translation initiation factor IF-2